MLTNVVFVADVRPQVPVFHEGQYDQRQILDVDRDADQTQHVHVVELLHAQRLLEELTSLAGCVQSRVVCENIGAVHITMVEISGKPIAMKAYVDVLF